MSIDEIHLVPHQVQQRLAYEVDYQPGDEMPSLRALFEELIIRQGVGVCLAKDAGLVARWAVAGLHADLTFRAALVTAYDLGDVDGLLGYLAVRWNAQPRAVWPRNRADDGTPDQGLPPLLAEHRPVRGP